MNRTHLQYCSNPTFLFSAKLRVTVDGGTNRWHSFVKQNPFNYLKIPDFITGDMDSADPAIIEQYVSSGSMIVHMPNQDETDFTKALMEVKKYSASNTHKLFTNIYQCAILYLFVQFYRLESQKSIDSVIVMVSMFHRVDHFLSNINTLYESKLKGHEHYFDKDIYLLGRNSLSWLLQAGRHRIHIPQLLRLYPEKNYIGIFPLGSTCDECTTTGLKWNLCKLLVLFLPSFMCYDITIIY